VRSLLAGFIMRDGTVDQLHEALDGLRLHAGHGGRRCPA
jgi:hypothetical protein